MFRRNAAQLQTTIHTLNAQGIDFDLFHSSYSTKIVYTETDQTILYGQYNYRDKVFAASRSIIKDLTNNPLAKEVASQTWPKQNFDSKRGWEAKKCKAVINLDITKAYATCLLNANLISQRTFNFLNSLKKHERLPAVGMIAKRSIVYRYRQGECVSYGLDTGEWHNIFMYIIWQVNEVMQRCAHAAGDYFTFYWVDGIFIDHKIDKQRLANVEQILQDAGFAYKYEKVVNFKAYRKEDRVYISMNKNGEEKNYCYKDPSMARNYREMLDNMRIMYDQSI